MYEQNESYWVKHSDLGAKILNKICLKLIQKVLNWPLQYANFQKSFGVACPRTSLEFFLFSICFKIILPKKTTLENISNLGALSLKKFLNMRRYENIFRRAFYVFFGSTSSYLVNIQRNSKFHFPHQNYLNLLLSAGSRFFF